MIQGFESPPLHHFSKPASLFRKLNPRGVRIQYLCTIFLIFDRYGNKTISRFLTRFWRCHGRRPVNGQLFWAGQGLLVLAGNHDEQMHDGRRHVVADPELQVQHLMFSVLFRNRSTFPPSVSQSSTKFSSHRRFIISYRPQSRRRGTNFGDPVSDRVGLYYHERARPSLLQVG